ncbi:hypothetical protein ACIBO6_36505, partial [Streptomyces luteogriseus]
MTTTHSGGARTSLREWATGLTVFAAIMLMIGGILDIMRGVAEIAEDGIFVSTPNYVFAFDLTAWGWIHLALRPVAKVPPAARRPARTLAAPAESPSTPSTRAS